MVFDADIRMKQKDELKFLSEHSRFWTIQKFYDIRPSGFCFISVQRRVGALLKSILFFVVVLTFNSMDVHADKRCASQVAELAVSESSSEEFSALNEALTLLAAARSSGDRDAEASIKGFLLAHSLNQKLVRFIAESIHKNLPHSVELDDLIGEGIFGLIDAVNGFDSSKGYAFSTYAQPRIRGSILDYLRDLNWTSRTQQYRSRIQEAAKDSLSKAGVQSTSESLAEEVEQILTEHRKTALKKWETKFFQRKRRLPSDEELESKRKALKAKFERELENVLTRSKLTVEIESLNRIVTKGRDGDARELQDFLSDQGPSRSRTPGVLLQQQNAEFKEELQKALPNRQSRLAIVLYYYEDMTMKDIGNALGVSESRVSHIISLAILQLRAKFRDSSYRWY